MEATWVLLWLIIIIFGFVTFFGAPYLPTKKKQIESALDILDLQPGDTLLELGSGDGRVLKAAAKKGLNAVGFELNPLLALFSYIYTIKYRKKVRIICRNFWWAKWPPAKGAFIFSASKYMHKLNKKIVQYPYKPIRVASFAFQIPSQKYIAKKDGIYFYHYI